MNLSNEQKCRTTSVTTPCLLFSARDFALPVMRMSCNVVKIRMHQFTTPICTSLRVQSKSRVTPSKLALIIACCGYLRCHLVLYLTYCCHLTFSRTRHLVFQLPFNMVTMIQEGLEMVTLLRSGSSILEEALIYVSIQSDYANVRVRKICPAG